jgi:hypothetical protein
MRSGNSCRGNFRTIIIEGQLPMPLPGWKHSRGLHGRIRHPANMSSSALPLPAVVRHATSTAVGGSFEGLVPRSQAL